jgi:hypothetical protein
MGSKGFALNSGSDFILTGVDFGFYYNTVGALYKKLACGTSKLGKIVCYKQHHITGYHLQLYAICVECVFAVLTGASWTCEQRDCGS